MNINIILTQRLYEGLKKKISGLSNSRNPCLETGQGMGTVYELFFQCFRIAIYYRNNPLAKFELASD